MRRPRTEDEYWEQRDLRVEQSRDDAVLEPKGTMSMISRYVEHLVCQYSEENFGQEAVEWAIFSGRIKLTFTLETDLRTIMGEPGQPETGQYSPIIEAYQAEVRKNSELLYATYGPILKQLEKAA